VAWSYHPVKHKLAAFLPVFVVAELGVHNLFQLEWLLRNEHSAHHPK
jgi:hypothetical protein